MRIHLATTLVFIGCATQMANTREPALDFSNEMRQYVDEPIGQLAKPVTVNEGIMPRQEFEREATLRARSSYRPGSEASLFRDKSGRYQDFRAFRVMDILTIVINESARGVKQANTRLTTASTFDIALSKLFGIESSVVSRNTQVDPTSLLSSETESEFNGQGTTNRQDQLVANISAIVKEVLPSGILRIEGEKIITVNGEEQNMRISGLVRPHDINGNNEINSRNISHLRIDYFGKGSIGDGQNRGWFSEILYRIWPF